MKHRFMAYLKAVKRAILLAIILADRNEVLQILSMSQEKISAFCLKIKKKKKKKLEELVLVKGGSCGACSGKHSVAYDFRLSAKGVQDVNIN